MTKKILYLFEAGDWDSRMAVAYAAQERGYDVSIGLLNGTAADLARAEGSFRASIVGEKAQAKRMGLGAALHMVADIRNLLREENPDIVHAVTLKYSFITGIAAFSRPSMRKVFTLAGLGYVFRGDNKKSSMLRTALRPFLTHVFKRPNTTLIFQNQDDLDLMVEKGYARKDQCVLIKGSGVYLDRFQPGESNDSDMPVVLMPTRLVHEKGVAVFIQAARLLKERGIDAAFHIVGGITHHNPRAITQEEMEQMTACGSVQWLGPVDDLPERLSRATVVAYPSYYGEGIPRVLLESCAAGRAIVTTDHPGCREAVEHGINGLLVPVKDPHETADAIHDLLAHPDKRSRMERHSRRRAEGEFDIHVIVNHTINLYDDVAM